LLLTNINTSYENALIYHVKENVIMALFGKKKNEEKSAACCCNCNCNPEGMEEAEKAKADGASVKVLGSGCAKCNQLEAATEAALLQLGMDSSIDHVTDFAQIAAYGVMTTPALVVDGKVVSYGKVLKTDEVVKILQKIRG
jgi:small redox-active disulfide protein 2